MRSNTLFLALLAAAFATTTAFAQQKSDDMKGMDMKAMEAKGSHPQGDMAGMDMGKKSSATQGTHQAKGTVKKVDQKLATVTLAHEPISSLSWPAMTMSFKVKDKALLTKFAAGKQVDVEFEKQGEDYVIKKVK